MASDQVAALSEGSPPILVISPQQTLQNTPESKTTTGNVEENIVLVEGKCTVFSFCSVKYYYIYEYTKIICILNKCKIRIKGFLKIFSILNTCIPFH